MKLLFLLGYGEKNNKSYSAVNSKDEYRKSCQNIIRPEGRWK